MITKHLNNGREPLQKNRCPAILREALVIQLIMRGRLLATWTPCHRNNEFITCELTAVKQTFIGRSSQYISVLISIFLSFFCCLFVFKSNSQCGNEIIQKQNGRLFKHRDVAGFLIHFQFYIKFTFSLFNSFPFVLQAGRVAHVARFICKAFK